MTTPSVAETEIEVARTRNDVRRQLDLLSEAASEWPPRFSKGPPTIETPRIWALLPVDASRLVGYIRDLEQLARKRRAR